MEEFDFNRVRMAGRMVFSVQGMWCVSCAMALQRALRAVPGVEDVSVNFTSGSALLVWDPNAIDFSLVLGRANRLGYQLSPVRDNTELVQSIDKQTQRIRLQLVVAVVLGMWSMLGSWVLYLSPVISQQPEGLVLAWVSTLASLPVVIYSGQDFFRAALKTIRVGVAGMDVMVSVGVAGSLGVSISNLLAGRPEIYVDAATMLITFLLIGRLIEIHAREESRLAVEALAGLAPEVATRLNGSASEAVLLDAISPGEYVLVRAGERVPVDGVVTEGESTVDRSLLTGEPVPMPVRVGDEVVAGSVNLSSPMTLRVTAGKGKRRIDVLGLRMVELLGARPSLSLTAERFVRWLFPAVSMAAVLAFLRYLDTGAPTEQAIIGALSLLVAACPCAVGMAMPLAYAMGSRQAANHGLLWRDPASMEGLARADIVAFDKTGTLTSGELELTQVSTTPDLHADYVVQLACMAEHGVIHPVASALRREATRRGWPDSTSAMGHVTRCGEGVLMQEPSGGRVCVGARSWLEASGIEGLPAEDSMPGVVHVARNSVWLGALTFRDAPREEAEEALRKLAADGLQVWLVTGDSQQSAGHFTHALGFKFDRVLAACSPDEKVKHLQDSGGRAAFVGDGVNDALVLAGAASGIAIPGASSVAVAAAGMVVTRGGVEQIVKARALARHTYRIIQQNLGFSIAYNVAIVVVLFDIGATPFAAAIAMLLSSVSVFLNSCRLAASTGGGAGAQRPWPSRDS